MHDFGANADASPTLSIVIPVRDEADNVAPLAREIHQALARFCAFEIIFVDDASTDKTVKNILTVRRDHVPQIRVLRHCVGCGQSIAVRNGVLAARAEWIVTLDGDGQNDPADIPALLQALKQCERAGDLKLIVGNRTSRQDDWVRRSSSRIANVVRRRLLRDDTPDTGCGIKLFHRATFLELPRSITCTDSCPRCSSAPAPGWSPWRSVIDHALPVAPNTASRIASGSASSICSAFAG